MIDNYLDFVKEQRKRATASARHSLYESRKHNEPWHNGFCRGLKLAYEFESRHWRTLQKDIECRNEDGGSIAEVVYSTSKIYKIL